MLFSFLIIFLHFSIYSFNKERNYYEKLEIPRVFNTSELKRSFRQIQLKYHPDKIKEKGQNDEKNYIEYREIYDILSDSDSDFKAIYDKFGQKNDKLNGNNEKDEKNQVNLILTLAEALLIYSVYLIFAIILTYDENVKGSRKWFLLIIFLAIFLELYLYFFKNLKENDIIDEFFPHSAIFERVEVIRFSVGPLGNLIRSFYRVFYKLPFDLILEQNERIMGFQAEIAVLLNKKTAKNEIFNRLEILEGLSGEIYQNIDKEIKKRELMGQIGWFKKVMKWGVILLMIYGVLNNVVNSNQDKQEL